MPNNHTLDETMEDNTVFLLEIRPISASIARNRNCAWALPINF